MQIGEEKKKVPTYLQTKIPISKSKIIDTLNFRVYLVFQK